ncbi:MAG: uridine diphosphate-N-acetylglucosamine-binding protein YvcK [Actinobacteria bacterium]|nr:uridine diphosphate-N-acetylglucosamine-binding protein YvcK [Actinomycetota bacterium]
MTRAQGPRVVAVGGGHGLAASLRAIRTYASEITAVVSVADDGGSSGRLRDELGIPAPGDLRKCLVALGDADSIWTQALEHRFDAGPLSGHPLGNLMIAGLTGATGDFTVALYEVGRLIGAVGRVLPATITPVVLKAEVSGREIEGQVNVAQSDHIATVSLVPADALTPQEVPEALAGADQIVIGPGSLFTSVLAAAIVPDVKAALAATSAQRVYVCNLLPQVPETSGFDVAAHVEALSAHGVVVDIVLCDLRSMALGNPGLPVVERDLARPNGLAHDPHLLAKALAELSDRL